MPTRFDLALSFPVYCLPIKADENIKEGYITRYSVYTIAVNEYRTYNGVTAHIYGSYDVVENTHVQNIHLYCTFTGGTGSCHFSVAGIQVCATITFFGVCSIIYV